MTSLVTSASFLALLLACVLVSLLVVFYNLPASSNTQTNEAHDNKQETLAEDNNRYGKLRDDERKNEEEEKEQEEIENRNDHQDPRSRLISHFNVESRFCFLSFGARRGAAKKAQYFIHHVG